MPDKEMIITPFIELKENDGRIIEPIEGTNDYLKKNGEKIAVLLGPNGDPGFVHELKARLRQIIISYAKDLEIKEVEDFEYVIEYHVAGLISLYQLWLEKGQNIDEESLGHVAYRRHAGFDELGLLAAECCEQDVCRQYHISLSSRTSAPTNIRCESKVQGCYGRGQASLEA